MDIDAVRKEAQGLMDRMTVDELRTLTQGRERTDPEHLAIMLGMQRDIEEGMAEEKAVIVKQERLEDIDRRVAEMIYQQAKERFRQEKLRHQSVEATFVKEKAAHKFERERHAQAVAQFQRDTEPWRKIRRDEKEVARVCEIRRSQAVQDDLNILRARQNDAQNKG